jgi:hypothetical protein
MDHGGLRFLKVGVGEFKNGPSIAPSWKPQTGIHYRSRFSLLNIFPTLSARINSAGKSGLIFYLPVFPEPAPGSLDLAA